MQNRQMTNRQYRALWYFSVRFPQTLIRTKGLSFRQADRAIKRFKQQKLEPAYDIDISPEMHRAYNLI